MSGTKSGNNNKRQGNERLVATTQPTKSGGVEVARSSKSGRFVEVKSGNKKTLANNIFSTKRGRSKITPSTEILDRIKGWAGGETEALIWFRSFPIPAFGDRTAESLVKTGKAEDVRDYLDAVAVGSFQ